MTVKIQLFGAFQVWREKENITTKIRSIGKADIILKILISNPGEIFTDEQLIDSIWAQELNEKKTDTEKAKLNLRKRISSLRKTLEPSKKPSDSSYIIKTPNGYVFSSDSDYQSDLKECQNDINKGNQHYEEEDYSIALRHFEAATDLMKREFLPDDKYENWAITFCENWANIEFDVYENMADCYARLGRYANAITICNRILLRTFRESVYFRLMCYEYRSGNITGALGAYDRCVKESQESFHSLPSQELQNLKRQIEEHNVPFIDESYPASKDFNHLPYTLSPGSVPFVGRRKELAQLHSALKKSQGQLIMISGEAGIGKTRLVNEFLTSTLSSEQSIVFTCKLTELHREKPLEAIKNALLDHFNDFGTKKLADLPKPDLSQIYYFLPNLVIDQIDYELHQPIEKDLIVIFESIGRYLKELNEDGKKIIWHIDDLHWIDSTVFSFLEFFAEKLKEFSILFVGTYRIESVKKNQLLLRLSKNKYYDDYLTSFSVTRLLDNEIIDLLKTFPFELEQQSHFYNWLCKQSEGNPLYLITTLRYMFDHELLKVVNNKWINNALSYDDLENLLPDTITEIINLQLQDLSDSEKRILQIASALGSRFEARLLTTLLKSNNVPSDIYQLAQSHLFVEAEGFFEFSHDKIREVVYHSMPEQLRLLWHDRILIALEYIYGSDAPQWVSTFAFHAFEARNWEATLKYTHKALELAVRDYQFHQGIYLAKRGLQAIEKLKEHEFRKDFLDTARFKILDFRSELLNLQGERSKQKQDIDEMEELATHLNDDSMLALVHKKRGTMLRRMGQFEKAEACYRQGLELYEALNDETGIEECWSGIGGSSSDLGDYDKSIDAHNKALELSKGKNPIQEARAYNSLGKIYFYSGKYDVALEHYFKALKIYESFKHPLDYANVVNNIGGSYANIGKIEEALQYFSDALNLRTELGDRKGQIISLNNIGAIHGMMGNHETAIEFNEKALTMRQEIGDRRGEALSYVNIATQFGLREYFAEALEYLEKSVAISEEIGDKLMTATARTAMASALRGLNRHKEAIINYRQARKVFDELENFNRKLEGLTWESISHLRLGNKKEAEEISLQAIQMLEEGYTCEVPQEVYYNHYKVLKESNKSEASLDYLKKAYDILMDRANKMSDPKRKRAYLTDVEINHQIVEFWEQNSSSKSKA